MFKNYFTLLVLIVAVNSLFAQMYVPDNYKGVAAIIGGETILEDHAGNVALKDKLLALDYAVNYYRDGDMEGGTVPKDTIMKNDFLVISETASSSKVRQLRRWEFSIPTINMEVASVQNTHHKLELISTVVGGNGWLPKTDPQANTIKILNGDHVLAAGFATGDTLKAIGDVAEYIASHPFAEGIIGYMADEIGVIPIASFNTPDGDTAFVICGIEVGTVQIEGIVFHARYVQFNLYSYTMTRWTTATDSLFSAAIDWILDTRTSVDGQAIISGPKEFALHQNYPNPFNPSTKIKYTLPESDHVRIEVYNTLGQSMGVLLDDSMPAGEHEVTFNAQVLPSGVYFYGIKTGQFSDVKKMILLK